MAHAINKAPPVLARFETSPYKTKLAKRTSPKKKRLPSLATSSETWIEHYQDEFLREIVADWRKEQQEEERAAIAEEGDERGDHMHELPRPQQLKREEVPTRSQEMQQTIEFHARRQNATPLEYSDKLFPPHSSASVAVVPGSLTQPPSPSQLARRPVWSHAAVVLPPMQAQSTASPLPRTQTASLVSREMKYRLQSQLEAKMAGSKWNSEVCSSLARPLDAAAFCDVHVHPLDGPHFEHKQLTFPYAVVVHHQARRLGQWYRRQKFRRSVLQHLDQIAKHIVVLRKTFTVFGHVHRLTKGNQKRQKRFHFLTLRVSARLIQIRWRKYYAWRKRIIRGLAVRHFDSQLLPQAMHQAFVSRTIAATHLLVVEQVEIWCQSGLERYVSFNDSKRDAARGSYLHFWVQRARIVLLIMDKWPKLLFRARVHNVDRMVLLVGVLREAGEAAQSQFEAFMATIEGQKALEEAVLAWRTQVQRQHETNKRLVMHSPRHFANDKAQQEYLRVCRCFEHFDLDRSGTIDWDEFQLFMQMLLREPTYASNQAQGTEVNNDDAEVPKPASPVPSSRRKPQQLEEWRKCFDAIDSSHNKSISLDDFYDWWIRESHRPAATNGSMLWNKLGRDAWWHLVGKAALEKEIVRHKMLSQAQASARERARKRFFEEELRKQQQSNGPLRVRWRQCTQCLLTFATQFELWSHKCAAKVSTDDPFDLERWILAQRQRWKIS